MPTPYYDNLVSLIQENGEVTQLLYDMQNASTALALQEVTKRLFNVTTHLLYHSVALTEELVRLRVLQRLSTSRSPAAVAPAPAPVPAPAFPSYPAPPTIPLPNLAPPASSTSMGDLTPCDVAQVVITPTGTRVIPPAGTGAAPVVLPPNTPVRLDQVQGRPVPPPAPPGVSQVVLPQGGALPPEMQAALDSRQGQAPDPTSR